jgi:hypothetical protein
MRCAVAGLLAGAVIVAALVAQGGGDGGGGAAQAAEPPAATFVRRCDVGSSVPARPVHRRDVAGGPLRFDAARQWARTRARDVYSPPGTRLKVIKAPAVITGSRAVTVAVARRDRAVLALDFDIAGRSPKTVGAGDSVVRFEVCPRTGRMSGYAGGFVYGGRWKRCVALDIWVDGRNGPIRRNLSLGAGRRCNR